MDVDIPSSPPPLPLSWQPTKRAFSIDDNLSSDPVFSEDASGDDETSSGRRPKRIYRGPWWSHKRDNKSKRRELQFADSGVWLASESSEASNTGSVNTDASIGQADDGPHVDDGDRASASHPLYCPEAAAASIVLGCVENGKENVDLSDLGLPVLPESAILPLNQMIVAKSMDQPDSDNFAPLTPDIRLFLSNNGLVDLGDGPWTIENITVLSVRNNCLSELPPGIGRLHRLQELNIAGNQISYLPWELLQLIRSRRGETLRLTTHPNPLLLPVPRSEVEALPPVSLHSGLSRPNVPSDSCEPRSESGLIFETMMSRVSEAWRSRRNHEDATHMVPMFAAASRILLYELDGTPCPSTAGISDLPAERLWQAELKPSADVLPEATALPSLLELAARGLHRRSHKLLLKLNAAEEHAFGVNDRVLGTLRALRARKLSLCNVCLRPYVFQRAQWVEYWHCSMTEAPVPSQLLFLPFMRRACSWGCVRYAFDEHSVKR